MYARVGCHDAVGSVLAVHDSDKLPEFLYGNAGSKALSCFGLNKYQLSEAQRLNHFNDSVYSVVVGAGSEFLPYDRIAVKRFYRLQSKHFHKYAAQYIYSLHVHQLELV